MSLRSRTAHVKKLKERRCSKCGGKLNRQVIRCRRCHSQQSRPTVR